MNKERREELWDVVELLNEASDRLNEIYRDEEESFDNLPDGLQMSRTGDSMQVAMETLMEFDGDIQLIADTIANYILPKRKCKKNK